jgi:hypothetical protein
MDDVWRFAGELLKLASVASLSAYLVSRLTARRFISERHWETKFEHYNRISQAMAEARRPGLRQVLGENYDDPLVEARTLKSALSELGNAAMLADLVVSPEAREACAIFLRNGTSALDALHAHDGRWKDGVRLMRDQHGEFISLAKRDLQLSDSTTLVAHLWSRVARPRSSPEQKGSNPTDPRA